MPVPGFGRGENAKKAFSLLLAEKLTVENKLGKLDWQELPEGQDCRIIQFREGNSKIINSWPELHEWLKDRSEAFYKAFSPLVKSLDLEKD